MTQLGIKPANEVENGWRRDLFIGKGSNIPNSEIKDILRPTLRALGITKPQLLVWYILSQGTNMINSIKGMTHDQRVDKLAQLVLNLNGEFGRQSPIQ